MRSQAVWYGLARGDVRQAGTSWGGSGSKLSSLRFVLGTQELQKLLAGDGPWSARSQENGEEAGGMEAGDWCAM